MHTWFILAIIPPILWAMVNHIDKFLLKKYFKKGGIGTLLIFSSVIALFTLPFVLMFDTSVLDVDFRDGFLLFINGMLSVGALWLYFTALKREEASIVVVFYQLIPVFALIMGFFVLRERISLIQLVAMFLIIAGTMIVSFEVDEENRFKLRKKTIFLMVFSALIYAINSILFKFVAINERFWPSIFWEYLGLGVFGLILLAFVEKYREDFMLMVKNNSKAIFSLNIFSEIIYIIGNFMASYAFLLAPVALVLLINSYQPIFVFIIGAILTAFFPKVSVESLHIRHIIQKLTAIMVVGVGTYLLFV